MKQFPKLLLLLAVIFAAAACGGSESGQSEQSEPATPSKTQAASTTEGASENTPPTKKKPPRDGEAKKGVSGSADETTNIQPDPAEDAEPSGFSVTTLAGEEVALEGQDGVTALFFMAGY